MNQRTSNTVFLGSVIAGAALVALLAPAASATDPAAIVQPTLVDTATGAAGTGAAGIADAATPGATTTGAQAGIRAKTLCTDTLCVDAPTTPVVNLLPLSEAPERDSAAFSVAPATYSGTAGIPSFTNPTALPNTVTVLGRMEQNSSSAADPLLGTVPASHLSNVGDLQQVDSVTGLGLVSTF